MYGRSWRSLTSSSGQADRGGQIKRKAKKILCSRLPQRNNCFQTKPCIRTDSPEKPRHLKFCSSIFYLSSLPQLVALFYKWPQRRTNSVWRTLLNKTVRLGRGFCWTRMIQQRLLSSVWIRIERLIPVKSWYISDCFSNWNLVPVDSPQKHSLTIWSQREETIIRISLTGKRKVGNIHRHF